MSGPDIQQDLQFSTDSPEPQVSKEDPFRSIRAMMDTALRELDEDFNARYASSGLDSIPPEKLLRAQLLMALYTIRSEQQLMGQIGCNLLFRWFVGFSMDDAVWDHSTFTKNRDRLLGGEVARRFFGLVLSQAYRAFSVDGTLIEALASQKSYRPKDEDRPPGGGGRNPDVDSHGEKRPRDTHESKTDTDDLLFKKTKGSESKLAYLGHLLMENRHGLVANAQVTQATDTAEREAAVDMVQALSGTHRVTLGADKIYDTRGCVDALRCANVTPHVAQNTSNRSSAIDRRTTRHAVYVASQRFRKRIEECFGWAKTTGGLRKRRFAGREKLEFQLVLTMEAYNLVRKRDLGGEGAVCLLSGFFIVWSG
jgi:transposase